MKKLLSILWTLITPLTVLADDYWLKVPVPTTKRLLTVSFGSPETGYIGGTDSTLLKTSDGGKTWSAVHPSGMSFSASSPDIIDLEFVSSTTGFAIVSNRTDPVFRGAVYKTTDGGLTWNAESAIIAGFRMFLFDAGNGLAVGSGFFSGDNVTRLSAGTWQSPQYLSNISGSFLRTVDFLDRNTGIAGGDSGRVYRTFNGGITWDTVKTNIDTAINGLKFISADTILGVTANNGAAVIISTDKGKTWSFDMASATFYYPDMKAVTRSRKDSLIMVGHSVTTGSGIIYYYDKTSFMNIFTADQDLNDVHMANDSVAFITGDSGLLLSNIHITTSVQENLMSAATVHTVPNPAQSTFTVRSEMPASVTVWDMQGRFLLTDDRRIQEHKIDMRGYTSGIYFVEVKAADGSAFRGKLTLE
ncbi:MAG: YCF48-related protein [Chitinophagaceae bacterium]